MESRAAQSLDSQLQRIRQIRYNVLEQQRNELPECTSEKESIKVKMEEERRREIEEIREILNAAHAADVERMNLKLYQW